MNKKTFNVPREDLEHICFCRGIEVTDEDTVKTLRAKLINGVEEEEDCCEEESEGEPEED